MGLSASTPEETMEKPAELVETLHKEEALAEKLQSPAKTLVVLEFVKTGNVLCNYVKTDRDKIAKEKEEKAVFYELDVGKFKKSAENYQVEALPAFVVIKDSKKKDLVVGTEDLRKAIDDAA